jgi:hypothetical protein
MSPTIDMDDESADDLVMVRGIDNQEGCRIIGTFSSG